MTVYILQQLDSDGRPRYPHFYRAGRGVTGRVEDASTWPTMEDAVDAAPGPGWRPVAKERVLQEIATGRY